MAIKKLDEVSVIKRGSSPRPINQWLLKNGLMWAKIADLNGNYLYKTKEFIDPIWETKGLIGNYGDLLITNSATPGVPFIQYAKKVAYHDGFLSIKCNENLILKKYLFYKLILDRPKLIKMGNGAVFINLSSEILKNWNIFIPNIITQQQIIDIIEPLEKIENVISNTKKTIEKIISFRLFSTNDLIEKNVIWKSNGYAYKENEKNKSGSYKIFTIKNINDNKNFSKTNIIKNNLINAGDVLTGLSGTIGTASIVVENNWVSNQRTLLLRSNIPLNIKLSIEKQINLLLKNATGAVQKNITAHNILKLNTIKKYKYDEIINQLYIKLLMIEEKIINIKNHLITLLIK